LAESAAGGSGGRLGFVTTVVTVEVNKEKERDKKGGLLGLLYRLGGGGSGFQGALGRENALLAREGLA
jgi:hypothetical protein